MLKWYTQPERTFNKLLYRARKVIVDEKFLERLSRVPEAIVVSSFRTLEEQKDMVAKGASKTPDSNHRRGMAVDVVNWEEVQAKMRAVGLVNDISWDRNHFAYDGENVARKYPLYTVDNSTEYNQEEPMEKVFVEAIEKLVGKDYGDNLNDSEQKDAAGKLKEVKAKLDWGNQLELTNVRLLENNQELGDSLREATLARDEMAVTLKEYIAQAGTCEPALATCKENLRVQTEKAKEGMEVYGALELLVTAFKKMFNK